MKEHQGTEISSDPWKEHTTTLRKIWKNLLFEGEENEPWSGVPYGNMFSMNWDGSLSLFHDTEKPDL